MMKANVADLPRGSHAVITWSWSLFISLIFLRVKEKQNDAKQQRNENRENWKRERKLFVIQFWFWIIIWSYMKGCTASVMLINCLRSLIDIRISLFFLANFKFLWLTIYFPMGGVIWYNELDLRMDCSRNI